MISNIIQASSKLQWLQQLKSTKVTNQTQYSSNILNDHHFEYIKDIIQSKINQEIMTSRQKKNLQIGSYQDYLEQMLRDKDNPLQPQSQIFMAHMQIHRQLPLMEIQLSQLLEIALEIDQVQIKRRQEIITTLQGMFYSLNNTPHQKTVNKGLYHTIQKFKNKIIYNQQRHKHQKNTSIKYIMTIINFVLFKQHKLLLVNSSHDIYPYLKDCSSFLQTVQIRDMILLVRKQSEQIQIQNELQVQKMRMMIDKIIVFQKEEDVMRLGNYLTINMQILYQLIIMKNPSYYNPLRHMKNIFSSIFQRHQRNITFSINLQQLLHLKFIVLSENIKTLKSIIKEITKYNYLEALDFSSTIMPDNYLYTYKQFEIILEQHLSQKHFNFQSPQIKNMYSFVQSMPFQLKPREKFDLSEINDNLRKHDIMALKRYWILGLPSYIQHLISNWSMYKDNNSQELIIFAHINDYNIQKFKFCKFQDFLNSTFEFISFYQLIYPNITIIIQKILNMFRSVTIQAQIYGERKKMKVPINFDYSVCKQKFLKLYEKKYNIAENKLTDQLIDIYIKEESQKVRGKTSNIKNLKIKLENGQYINIYSFVMKFEGFYRHFGEWSDVLSKIKSQLQFQYNKQQKKIQFYQDIHNERMIQHHCLGCSTFFYIKMNIYDESVNKIPVKSFPSIKQLNIYETQVKDDICSMINSGGGIILFDCRLQFKSIIIQGSQLSQKQKQQIQNRIYSYLNHFYPKLLPKFNIMVQFVPLINYQQNCNGQLVSFSGQDNVLKTNRFYKQRQYMQNWFVTRIKIIPTNADKVYFWYTESSNGNKREIVNKYCSVRHQGQSKQLSMFQMRKLIKKKTTCYQEELNLTAQQLKYKRSRYSYFDHSCKDAEKNQQKEAVINKKVHHNHHQLFINYEQKYKNTAIIYIQNKNDVKFIKELLQKNKFQFIIQPYANNHHLKSAQKAYLIFYNKKVSDMKALLSNTNTFLLNITSFIKYVKINEEQFSRYTNLFNEQFKQEYIRFYEFILQNGQKEYYFQTQNKISTVFLYFLLKQRPGMNPYKMEQPILICPFLLDKLSLEQRQRRFILFFEKKANFCQKHQLSEDVQQQSAQYAQEYQFYQNTYYKGFQSSLFDRCSQT